MDTPTNTNTALILAAIAGQIITFLGVLASMWVSTYRENRNHRWAVEEREAIAAELSRTAAALATNAASSAALLASTATSAAADLAARGALAQAQIEAMIAAHKTATNDAGRRIEDAIKHNTSLTEEAAAAAREAFQEANQINRKIATLGLTHNELDIAILKTENDRK